MLALQIENKKIESAFATKFNADKDKLISFIENSLKTLEQTNDQEFQVNHLDPLDNYHMLEVDDEKGAQLSNPFNKNDDSVALSKKLRDSSYR